MKSLVKIARVLANLDADARKFVDEYVKLLNETEDAKKSPGPKPKRKYTRRAKAVEVAPGVKVVRKKRAPAAEIDHSPRSVEEQERG